MKKTKTTPNKEEIAEDWCFICKDGGLLLVCDYKQCLKAYHSECAAKDDAFLRTGKRWNCTWHSCFICHKASKFQCYCCPKAVCQRCITLAEFGQVKGNKGFCSNCLKLALLVEENINVDSDGEEVDFNDRETFEGLFKEYWDIIKKDEGLTKENLLSAKTRLKMSQNYKSSSDSDELYKEEENQTASDYEEMVDIEEREQRHKKKTYGGQRSGTKTKGKSNRTEFIGWRSKSLMQFLTSIDKDTSQKLSQHEVTSIVNKYIKENNLFDTVKKRNVVCDAKLRSLFGRKTINKHRVYDLLEPHLAENQEESEEEEDELEYNSDDEDEIAIRPCKKLSKSDMDKKSQKEEVVHSVPQLLFASIVAENLKLVYLKRSLVEELMKHPESFESKVIGSFVRAKADPNDYLHKGSFQLVQVTGIKKNSLGESNAEIILQASEMQRDISVSMLSDGNFSEEECEDLRQRVKNGSLKKPTLMEFEDKVRSLHEDMTKHSIAKELASLPTLIDRANEKGWRKELYEYLQRKKLLQTSSEQLRLLQTVPEIIPDVEEVEPVLESAVDNKQGDIDSPKSFQKEPYPSPSEQNQKESGPSSTEEPPHQINEAKENKQMDTVQKSQQALDIYVIESSGDDDSDDDLRSSTKKQKSEDKESSEWLCLGPNGERKGPYSLSFLERWSASSPYARKFKVWNKTQRENESIPMTKAIRQASKKR